MLKWNEQVKETASDLGFTAYDHFSEFKAALDGQVLGVNVLDGHPSAAENQIYGRKLALKINTLLEQQTK